MLICGDLDSIVALDEIYGTTNLNTMIKPPVSLLQFLVGNLLKKQHPARTPDNQSFPIDQDHLPQIRVGHLFKTVLCEVISIYDEDLTLSIERVDLIFLNIIEAL